MGRLMDEGLEGLRGICGYCGGNIGYSFLQKNFGG